MEQKNSRMVFDENDYLNAVREHAPASTKEIADAVGVTRQGADYRLREMESDGKVSKKMVGNSLVWMVDGREDDTDETHAARDDASADGTGTMDTTRKSKSRSTAAHGAERAATISETIDAIADDVLPGGGSKLDARREALHAVVEYLREHGTATPSDFQTDVYPDHPARYTDGEDPPNSWWNNCIYKGLGAFADRTGVVERPDTSGDWTWVGGDRGDDA